MEILLSSVICIVLLFLAYFMVFVLLSAASDADNKIESYMEEYEKWWE